MDVGFIICGETAEAAGDGTRSVPTTQMFESLQTGLRSALKTLSGKAKLTEANMREGLALVQQSLLEADVSYEVAKDFVARVADR